MALLAYNLTVSPLLLAAGSTSVTLGAAAAVGLRGAAYDVTAELKGLSAIGGFDLLQVQVAANSVQYEWSDFPEFNTFTLVVRSAQTDVYDADLEIYVDAVTGDDGNLGIATAKVKTWDRAFSLMAVGSKKRRIYLAAGTYDLTSAGLPARDYTFPPSRRGGEPVVIIGDNTTVQTDSIATVSSAQGGQRIFTRTTPAAAAIGAAVTFTSGASTGRRVLIAFDDGTQITLNNAAGAVIAPGDTFIIERPASIFRLTDNAIGFIGAPFGLKNIKFTSTGAPRTMRVVEFAHCTSIENVQIDTNALIFVVGNHAIFRTASDDNGYLTPNPFSRALRRSCGLYLDGSAGTNGGMVIDRKSTLGQGTGGGVVLNQASLQMQSEAQFLQSTPPPCGTNSVISVEQGGFMNLDAASTVHGIFNGSYPGANAFPVISVGALFPTGASSEGGRASIRRISINNALVDGIKVSIHSFVNLDEVAGANNAGYGIKMINAGSVMTQTSTPGSAAGNTNCTLTGRNGVVLSSAITDSPLTSGAATVNVASTTSFPTAGVIKIDNEMISYTGVTATSFTGCVRGVADTLPVSHLVGALASQASGADTIIGGTPKLYSAVNGTPVFAELSSGMPTGNAFAIRQA